MPKLDIHFQPEKKSAKGGAPSFDQIKLMIIVSSLQDHQNADYRSCQKQIDDHLLVTLVTASSLAHGVSCMLRQQIEHLTTSDDKHWHHH